ncbi:NAD(P)H-binding protein [Psittacicella hinzii]|uniref:NAD(P)-binding domain-containing protein n=1 Tax=Psittacicella hinzii TaxID=2028575 RepID=A0A3A1YIW8_9GAMM|nr:NAD(P)H-binding protein [Psittacicella hinzii]RIY37148.1 hypothetical protein CKF58_05180 [Psittacicella hinzii]
MKNVQPAKQVLYIGATGSLGQVVIPDLIANTQAHFTLMARNLDYLRLPQVDSQRYSLLPGDATNLATLVKAMQGKDLVIVAVSGSMVKIAKTVIQAMQETRVKRLIFVSSYGIYGEITGNRGINSMLMPYREAADAVELSALDYTIMRPGWFDNSSDRSFTLFVKGEIITGNNISRLALATFMAQIINQPAKYNKQSVGLVRD